MKKPTQTQRLLNHLALGRTLTRYEAIMMFRVQNPTARISEIRELVGDMLVTDMKVDPNGQKYAEYRLDMPDVRRMVAQ